ncbi:MAG: hypothetical protein K8L91_28680 [Anaerolineae bacterium]|nr:hypothetical protein [Anaerolineae bacterium]
MGNLGTAIEAFFTDLRALAQIVAPIFAFLGVLGLGLMYLGSSIPVIAEWKKNNPQASSSVVMGLIFVLLASSVASLISFT